ncbi:MAG: hypothetical protein RIT14_2534, partial [Pseudomonadota bacterium]
MADPRPARLTDRAPLAPLLAAGWAMQPDRD